MTPVPKVAALSAWAGDVIMTAASRNEERMRFIMNTP
jgi:hypothetical protein